MVHIENMEETKIIDELLSYWKIPELFFVGKLTISPSNHYFFNDIELGGQPAYYPNSIEPLSIYCPANEKLKKDTYYSFHAKPSSPKHRIDNQYKLIV